MRRKIFVLLFVLASLLAACSAPVEQVSTPPSPLTREEVSEIAAQAAAEAVAGIEFPEPVVVEVQVLEQEPAAVESVEEPVVEPMVAECPLKDQGIRIEFLNVLEKENGFYNLASEMEQLADYAGCNILVEGRQTLDPEHHIWVFSGPDWELPVREASLWVYPIGWNMADFSTVKPPIASEFVTAKRHNQLANDYDWVIFVHVGENTYVFPAGQDTPVVILPDNAQFSDPQPLAVHGVWDGSAFNASIGAEGATTVALLDDQLAFWVNAQDNVIFSSVQAWLMPSTWTEAQVKTWAEAQFPGKSLTAYAP